MTTPKFKRSSRRRNTVDGVGTVRITVHLIGKHSNHKPGNITRSWHVPLARVSDVAQVLEETLFDYARLSFRGTDRTPVPEG